MTLDTRFPGLPPAAGAQVATDISACARELIHIPGSTQPHGALLAVLATTRRVTHASANLSDHLGIDAAAAIGELLATLLGDDDCAALLDRSPGAVVKVVSLGTRVDLRGNSVYLRSHRSGPHVCIDIEPMSDLPDRQMPLIQTQTVIDSFRNARTHLTLCEAAVGGLKQITGYDRVMAYRFGASGDGDVIAEECSDGLPRYLGLRYPASDIPPQARSHYLRQRVGSIADSGYEPVPLLTDGTATEHLPLDLTHSALRSVSPVHREYMRNMKTAASLTIGLAHGNELWGMLVCHHATPRVADPELRAAAGLVGQVVSLLISSLGTIERAAEQAARGDVLSALLAGLRSERSLHDALVDAGPMVLALANAAGALVRLGGETTLLGRTPPLALAEATLDVMQAGAGGSVVGCDDLVLRHSQLDGCRAEGSGALLLPLGSAGDAILWFRPELSSTVTWGGDPGHHVSADPISGRLSPRASFAAWRETVRGHSAAWSEADLALADEFGRAMAMESARRTRAELHQSESRFQLLAEHSGVVVTLNDMSSTRRYVSPAAESVLGWRPEDMVGRSAIEMVHPDDRPAFEAAHAALLDGTAERSACYRYMRPDGSWLWVEGHARLRVGAGSSEPTDYVVVLRDASERKAAEMKLAAALDRMERMASIDGLTGLANRRHLDLIAGREWQRCEREHLALSVLLVDADHFKLFNDRYGHLAGDVCLRAISAQLETLSRRPGDLAARYGGEEFLLLLPNTGLSGAVQVANQLCALVCGLAIDHEDNKPSGVVTVSVGVARAWPGRPGAEQPTLEALLLDADAALYQAKSSGRNRVVAGSGVREENSRYGNLDESTAGASTRPAGLAVQLAPLSEQAGAHEALMQFLYRAPIGLVQTALDGSIEMINPMSASLLMPLSRNGNLDNLFVALDGVAPQLRQSAEAYEESSGPICESVRISLASVTDDDAAAQVLSISLLKLDAYRLMATVSDVTHEVRREQHLLARGLSAAARIDPLTQMPNRAAIRDLIQRAIDTAHLETGSEFAVVFINCDRFKQINDAFGHGVGDEVLVLIAARLRATLKQLRRTSGATRIEQMAGRVGGDEFALLLEDLRSPGEARAIAAQLRALLSEPYLINGLPLHCGFSMGLVLQAQASSNADVVLQDASIAMVEAKRAGGARKIVFEPSMHERAAHRGNVEGDLRRALANDELFVVYQPVVALQAERDAGEGAACSAGVEALVRWRHPTRGVVPPLEFIEVAERCGLIGALGAFVLETACRQFVAWQHRLGLRAPRVLAVNLSRAQLSEPGFVASVAAVMGATGIAPAQLQLEVTESLAAQDESVQARLHELKALGLTLALDDFGTGYSSLASLHLLPVDTVKIDRSFVNEAVTSAHHRVLIEATVRVAASLHMRTVAEGIETDAQAALLRQLGCDLGQGYLFARPLSTTDLTDWLMSTPEL